MHLAYSTNLSTQETMVTVGIFTVICPIASNLMIKGLMYEQSWHSSPSSQILETNIHTHIANVLHSRSMTLIINVFIFYLKFNILYLKICSSANPFSNNLGWVLTKIVFPQISVNPLLQPSSWDTGLQILIYTERQWTPKSLDTFETAAKSKFCFGIMSQYRTDFVQNVPKTCHFKD